MSCLAAAWCLRSGDCQGFCARPRRGPSKWGSYLARKDHMMTTESHTGQDPVADEPFAEPVAAGVAPPGTAVVPTAVLGQHAWRQQLAAEMLNRAKAEGLRLVGRDGLLAGSPRRCWRRLCRPAG